MKDNGPAFFLCYTVTKVYRRLLRSRIENIEVLKPLLLFIDYLLFYFGAFFVFYLILNIIPSGAIDSLLFALFIVIILYFGYVGFETIIHFDKEDEDLPFSL
ncbi:MAG: hypothetical protein GY861_21570 [bacterium]|nr:hypothetical protein [bacterium]